MKAFHRLVQWWSDEGAGHAAVPPHGEAASWTRLPPGRQWPALVQRLTAYPQAVRHLQDTWGLSLAGARPLPADWLVEPGWAAVASLQDGAWLFVHERDGRVACVTPQGRSGCLAASPAQAWSLLLALPLWSVCLSHSGHGDLPQMLRLLPRLAQYEREALPCLPQARACLLATLGLPDAAPERWTHDGAYPRSEVVSDLHLAVSRLRAPQVWIRAQSTRSLFGHLPAAQWRPPRRAEFDPPAEGGWWVGTPATGA